jgi:retinol-binding protein 3
MTLKKIIVLIVFSWFMGRGGIAQQLPTLDQAAKSALLDSVGRAVRNYYVFPEKAKKLSLYIQKQSRRGRYDQLTNPHLLAQAITRDLRSVYLDQHLAVRYDPLLEKRIRDFLDGRQPDKKDIEKEKKENFFFKKAEVLPGNIGYLAFTGFADTSALARNTVRAALQFVAYTEALILDLTSNNGGNGAMANEVHSYFYGQRTLTGRRYNRLTNSWTTEWVENETRITGGLVLDMPLYILTSNRTYSAAEGLAYHLQHHKKATVVGDTTRGGAHLTRSFALGGGFVGFIPYSRSEQALTQTDWEGTGVIPAVAASDDKALIKAQELILTQRLSSASSDVESRKITWLLNDLKAQTAPLSLPPAVLNQYTGQFEEFLFILKDQRLFCINTHQKRSPDELKPVSDTLFKINAQSQVEFVRDPTGQVSSLKLLWEDGWVDVIKKIK